MGSATNLLLIDEDARRRTDAGSVLRASLHGARVIEISSGLDYAQNLAGGEVSAALAAERLSWGTGLEVLDAIKRHYPGSLTGLLSEPASITRPSQHHCVPIADEAALRAFSRLVDARAELFPREPDVPGLPSPADVPPSTDDVLAIGARYLADELNALKACEQAIIRGGVREPHARLIARFTRQAERLQAVAAGLGHPPRRSMDDPSPVKLAEAVLEAMRPLQAEITKIGARVMAGVLPSLLVDRQRLVQLFFHLVDNALKFRSGAPPRIMIHARQDPNAWVINVADNGCGIHADERDRIYEMFYRPSSSMALPGRGLGLALCRQIAARYDGAIWHEARRGGGAVFHVSLAVRAVEAAHEPISVRVNGCSVGRVWVRNIADKREITRAALTLPALDGWLDEGVIEDVRLLEGGVIDIIA